MAPTECPALHATFWSKVICFSSMAVMEFLPKIPLKVFKAWRGWGKRRRDSGQLLVLWDGRHRCAKRAQAVFGFWQVDG